MDLLFCLFTDKSSVPCFSLVSMLSQRRFHNDIWKVLELLVQMQPAGDVEAVSSSLVSFHIKRDARTSFAKCPRIPCRVASFRSSTLETVRWFHSASLYLLSHADDNLSIRAKSIYKLNKMTWYPSSPLVHHPVQTRGEIGSAAAGVFGDGAVIRSAADLFLADWCRLGGSKLIGVPH